MLIGAHQSIASSVAKSIDRAIADECESFQIFVKNANRWTGKPIADDDAERFRQAAADFGTMNITAHASYLINLGSPKTDVVEKSRAAFMDELGRCDLLGVPYYVMHPGSHLGEGLDEGIRRITSNIEALYDANGFSCMTLLEVTAGQGSSIGHRFEHIERIINDAACGEKLGVCLDSAHMYAAGYDLVNDYESVMGEVFARFGDKVKVFHLNDSKKELSTRVDRHEMIGKGVMGSEPFTAIVNDSRFSETLGILETPIGKDETYLAEVRMLKAMRRAS